MPEKRERERVLFEGQPATILERMRGGKLRIRTAFGYEREVKTSQVEELGKDDDRRTMTYVDE